MSLYDLRVYLESAVPWWAPVAIWIVLGAIPAISIWWHGRRAI